MPPKRRTQPPPQEPVNADRGQVNPMQQFVDLLVGALQNRNPITNVPNPVQPANRLVAFKDFKSLGPPEFQGVVNPIEAQTWIREIEKFFEVANEAEGQKTVFATFMLKEEASYW